MRGSRVAAAGSSTRGPHSGGAVALLAALVFLACSNGYPRAYSGAPRPADQVARFSVEGGRFTAVDRAPRSGDRIEILAGPHVLEVAFELRGSEIARDVGAAWSGTLRCRVELRAEGGRRYAILVRKSTKTEQVGARRGLRGVEIRDERGQPTPGNRDCDFHASPDAPA